MRCEPTVVWEFRKSKAFWSASLAIIYQAKVDDPSGGAEDVGYLLFGES